MKNFNIPKGSLKIAHSTPPIWPNNYPDTICIARKMLKS